MLFRDLTVTDMLNSLRNEAVYQVGYETGFRAALKDLSSKVSNSVSEYIDPYEEGGVILCLKNCSDELSEKVTEDIENGNIHSPQGAGEKRGFKNGTVFSYRSRPVRLHNEQRISGQADSARLRSNYGRMQFACKSRIVPVQRRDRLLHDQTV